MANSTYQNCQRGIIFVTFLAILLFFIINTINLIKKLIDPVEQQPKESKYQEGKEKGSEDKQKGDHSNVHFEQPIIQSSEIKEDDSTLIKVVKKVKEFQNLYLPLLVVIPLNIITGTSKAFSLVFYMFILPVVILFNVAKVHRKCIEHKCMRVILENLWLFMLFFELLNIWTTTTVMQPYIVIAG